MERAFAGDLHRHAKARYSDVQGRGEDRFDQASTWSAGGASIVTAAS
jgi:hypothetical protein